VSATTRLTRGRVWLASARVKWLRGTMEATLRRKASGSGDVGMWGSLGSPTPPLPHVPTISSDDYTLYLLRMRNETDHPSRPIHHHDRGGYWEIMLVEPLDPDPVELHVGRHDRRIGAHVVLGRAFLGVVPRGDAARHDVAIGDGAEVAAVFRIVHHRHDRDVLHAHQRGHLRAGGAGGGDIRIGGHHFGCAQPDLPRSEERRVGKEGRSPGSPDS